MTARRSGFVALALALLRSDRCPKQAGGQVRRDRSSLGGQRSDGAGALSRLTPAPGGRKMCDGGLAVTGGSLM